MQYSTNYCKILIVPFIFSGADYHQQYPYQSSKCNAAKVGGRTGHCECVYARTAKAKRGFLPIGAMAQIQNPA
ncbi:MAG: hypothetical protein ACLVKR_09325 [Lachnospiraceae bacterium]